MYRPVFGMFHESVTVDGMTFTFEEYKLLTVDERQAVSERFVKRCGEANIRYNAEVKALREPLEAEARNRLAEIKRSPRYATRYKGRAADLEREKLNLHHWKLRELHRLVSGLQKPVGIDYPALVHDIFQVWEGKVETLQERFDRLLPQIDWYSHYSDDYSVVRAGDRLVAEVEALASKLGPKALERFKAAKPR